MNRFTTLDRLTAGIRAELPGVAVIWLAALREPLEEITTAALDPEIGDEEFAAKVEEFSRSLPGLLDRIDDERLVRLFEGAMGAAIANGSTSRPLADEP